MKKWKQVLFAGVAVCTAISISASASNFDSAADSLKAMGLFAGTSIGYELDRTPTRAEAAVMLVRLLGKTAEAQELWALEQDAFAFHDMDAFDWAQPYVHWLARQGLAAGTSPNHFSPSAPCTAQMYTAFLMRALGYSESSGDFSFDNVLSFARSHGVINDVNCSTTAFLRDHIVATSYTALAAAPKSGEPDLLTKLVGSGAVSASAASMEQQKFSAYRGYAQAMLPTADGIALEHVTSLSANGGLSLDIAAVSSTRLRNRQLSSQNSLTITVPGKDPFVRERTGYYSSGRWYTRENGINTWRRAALEDLLQELAQPKAVPLVLIDEIRTNSSGYLLAYSTAGKAYYQNTLRQLTQAFQSTAALNNLTIQELSAEIRIKDGMLSSLSTGVIANGSLTDPDTETSTEVTIRAQQNSRISAIGSQVQVDIPSDLSTYTPAL